MVRRLETRGELQAVRIGRRVLFDVRELSRFVAAKTAESAVPA